MWGGLIDDGAAIIAPAAMSGEWPIYGDAKTSLEYFNEGNRFMGSVYLGSGIDEGHTIIEDIDKVKGK